MKILFTGFEPFGGEAINPAWEAVQRLPDEINSAAIIKRCLPVEFQSVERMIYEILGEVKPDAVVCVGQAGGRNGITVERVAINIDDSSVPDNVGYRPVDMPIRNGAPNAYFSTLPVKAIVKAINDAGIPAALSNSAGTYVCNHLEYCVLDYFSVRMLDKRAGFIHLPFMASQCVNREGVYGMELGDMIKALETAARVIAE